MTRKRLVLTVLASLLLFLAAAIALVVRQRVRRERVVHPTATSTAAAPREIPPVEQWTATFQQLEGEQLSDLLTAIEEQHPDLYTKYSLAYLHARALLEQNETNEAAAKLAPFLEKGNPFRDLALYHRASIAEGAEASKFRNTLIFEHPDSTYRDEAIDDELEWLAANPTALAAFEKRIAPTAPTERRREISARIVELTHDLNRGLTILKGGTNDDAADRTVRALDRPEILAKLTIQQLADFGETLQKHRHYDRAIAVLQSAVRKKYSDDLQFALGRAYFGGEHFAEAKAAYLRGAAITKNGPQKTTFFWHAARATQLLGDDRGAEQLMTNAIAVPGKSPATTAALTQRLRTRIRQHRFNEANADYLLLKKMAGKERAFLEGSLAMATGSLAMNRASYANTVLISIPRALQNDYDEAEIAYWRARALEASDPRASFAAYLQVLRAKAPTHFAYLARTRLDSPAMTQRLAQELSVRDAQVKNLIAAKKLELAKQVQTDRILLSSRDHKAQLATLANIYRQLPAYRAVLDLEPEALPRFPDPQNLLMAMGLFDEAAPFAEKHWPLRPQASALTRSYALNLGGASKDSIYAIEVMMKSVPADFHPDLLPTVVRQLLYPRYFMTFIAEDAKKYETDPTLVLSIMREESRFNPRAKSQAAARGLLQFIITTARDIGRDAGIVDVDPEDLYDPRIVIQLGAKYISELNKQLGGNHYRVTAAYNAGPKQVALWQRMQPAAGDDYFLTAVNFDETKDYVRKVMNSYERYGEIYGKGAPVGGLRAEP